MWVMWKSYTERLKDMWGWVNCQNDWEEIVRASETISQWAIESNKP